MILTQILSLDLLVIHFEIHDHESDNVSMISPLEYTLWRKYGPKYEVSELMKKVVAK